jgi:CRP-like cAMP-binding protein
MSGELHHYLRNLPSQSLRFAPGRYLFHLGDPVRVMHFVQSGRVHLTRTHLAGSVLILQQARSGTILAEASFCSERYHCDGVAVEATHSIAYAAADFRARVRSTPEFAEAWASHLARELQTARQHAEILSLKTVANRLDAWIAWHGGTLPAKGEWRMIASELSVSAEALYREIARRRPTSQSTNRHGGVLAE